MGPYRTRLSPPETHADFWQLLERQRRGRRRAPAVLLGLSLLPATVVALAASLPQGSEPRGPKLAASPELPGFGMRVDAHGTAGWQGGLPPGIARPSLDATTLSVDQLQALVEVGASSRLRSCFESSAARVPELAGDVVVSVVVDTRGVAHAVVAGPRSLRNALGQCVKTTFESLAYPRPRDDNHWFQYPVRFARDLSPG